MLGGAGMKEMIKKVQDGDPLITADVTYPPTMIRDAMRLTAKSRHDQSRHAQDHHHSQRAGDQEPTPPSSTSQIRRSKRGRR